MMQAHIFDQTSQIYGIIYVVILFSNERRLRNIV